MTGSSFFMAAQSVAEGVSLPAPLGHWPMNETSGTNVPDTSGNGNTGICYNGQATVGNGPTWTNDGTRGWCLSFDGSNDFVGMTNFATNGPFTCTAWIKPATTNTQKTITIKRNAAQNSVQNGTQSQIIFQISSTNLLNLFVYSSASVSQTMTGTTTIAQDTWQHVAATYAGTSAVSGLYVNGTQGGTHTYTAALYTATQMPFQIAARSGNNDGRYFQGLIDDVRLYNEALTTEQIQYIYSSTVL